MDLTVFLYIQIALVLAGASIVQGAAGFAFGMVATPLLLLAGLRPEQAIPLVAASATVQAVMGVWSLRQDVHWKLLAKVLPVAVAMLPVGVWLLGQVAAMESGRIRQIFGGLILSVLIIQGIWRVQPRDNLHIAWGWLAMAGAGLGSGMAGMAGPATALWVTCHRWPGRETRATMWTVFLVLMPPNLLFLYQRFGPVVGESLWQGSLFIPVVIVTTMAGLWIGNRLDAVAVRRLAMALLIGIAGYSILQPMVLPQLG